MKTTILIIDDEAGVIRMLKQMLEDAGYRVISTADGRAGVDEMAKEPVDLIITDIIMPEMEGIELIRHVKQIHPAVPVIAISGGGRPQGVDFLRFAERLGANATVAKPFRREELLAVVARVLALA